MNITKTKINNDSVDIVLPNGHFLNIKQEVYSKFEDPMDMIKTISEFAEIAYKNGVDDTKTNTDRNIY